MEKNFLNEKRVPEELVSSSYSTFFKNQRKALKLNADEAAEIIGTSPRTLRRLEGGWDIRLTFNSFIKMANLYNITIYFPSTYNDSVSSDEKKMNIISGVARMDRKQLDLFISMIDQMKDSSNSNRNDLKSLSQDQLSIVQDIPSLSDDQIDILYAVIKQFEVQNNKVGL